MRIMIVVSALTYGGAERQVVLLSRQLAAMGHAVMVYTLNDDVPRAGELEGSSVELVVDQKRRKLDFSVISRLRRRIRDWNADVVHGFLFDGDLYSRIAGAGLGIPVLNSERNDGYRLKRSQRIAYRLTRRWVDGVIANSHAGKRFAEQLHAMPSPSVDVVWNGIDLSEVDRRIPSDRGQCPEWPGTRVEDVVIVVGALKPQKDHALALEVAEVLHRRRPECRFLMVGDSLPLADTSAYKAEVLARYQRGGMSGYVKFLGPRSDVYEIMARSGVLLVTSKFEGFPNVVLEAMSVGLPVATTDYSDIRRIVPNHWQVAGGRDATELAAIIERCMRERLPLVRQQRGWVEQHATLAVAARCLLAVYERWIAVRSRPASRRSASASTS